MQNEIQMEIFQSEKHLQCHVLDMGQCKDYAALLDYVLQVRLHKIEHQLDACPMTDHVAECDYVVVVDLQQQLDFSQRRPVDAVTRLVLGAQLDLKQKAQCLQF